MTKGKQWTIGEESELKTLVDAKAPIAEIAAKFGRKPAAVFIKAHRLGLRIDVDGYTSSSVPIPKQLPSAEEALLMLAGALKAATKPGLDKVEVQRLQVLATIAKTYQELLSAYINYRKIEINLKDREEKDEKTLQTKEHTSQQNITSKPDSATMAKNPTE